jgi:hypothetical protein
VICNTLDVANVNELNENAMDIGTQQNSELTIRQKMSSKNVKLVRSKGRRLPVNDEGGKKLSNQKSLLHV